MTRFHEFDVAEAEATDEVVECRIAGTLFTFVPKLPFGILATFMAQVHNGRVPFPATWQFLVSCLEPGQEDAFTQVMYDRERPVSSELAQTIVDTLIGEYTGRPTPPPTGSPSGQANTTDSSAPGSSSPEPIPVP